MTAIRTKTKALGDRHTQITVTNRLAFITKALKTKSENRLVAVYAGFDTEQEAVNFSRWVAQHWQKSSHDLEVRPGNRTASAWEVKIRRPSEEQLAKLVEKARLHAPSQTAPSVGGHIPANALLAPRRMPTKVGGLSID